MTGKKKPVAKPAKKKTAGRTNGTPKKGPRKRTATDWSVRFLASLAGSANIHEACKAVKVGRTTVYKRRDDDEVFAQAMADALDDACDLLEMEARRRACDGCERAVYGSGGTGVGTVEVGRVVEYSDTLMIFLLKAHRPDKYRESFKHEHSGPNGKPIEFIEVRHSGGPDAGSETD